MTIDRHSIYLRNINVMPHRKTYMKIYLSPQCPLIFAGTAFRSETECIYFKTIMTIIKEITKEGFVIQITAGTNSLKRMQMLNVDWLGYHDEAAAVTKPSTLSWKFNAIAISFK